MFTAGDVFYLLGDSGMVRAASRFDELSSDSLQLRVRRDALLIAQRVNWRASARLLFRTV
jgi:hypothetical protein